ncbi:hypothetical protein DMENIID0001_028350 [Sergentomyia squamirostris]
MRMMQLKFPKKLFCFELKIGAIITGWVHLLLSILGIIFALILYGNHELYLHTMNYLLEEYNETTLAVFEDQDEKNVMELALKFSIGIYLFLSIVNLVGAGFLIYGAMKENHLLLLPWLTSEILGMFIMMCTMFIRCPFLIIIIFVRVYIWYCIWAFYRDTKRNKHQLPYPVTQPTVSVAFENNPENTNKPPPYGDIVTYK